VAEDRMRETAMAEHVGHERSQAGVHELFESTSPGPPARRADDIE
jgi:hypothetical protein